MLAPHVQSGIASRPDWMPDPGVYTYVREVLKDAFDINEDNLPEHWVPLVILGTMDWIALCGWWVWEYTGVYESDAPYKWIFSWRDGADIYEFDPDKLNLFEDNPELNKFNERMAHPGIEGRERSEAVQFIIQTFFPMWEKRPPPQDYVEVALWATLMWILSDYGRAWLGTKDDVFRSVYQFGLAYLSKWDNKLLDHRCMTRTEREIGTCRSCGNKLWCVEGFFTHEPGTEERVWGYLCNNCAVSLFENGVTMDEQDRRLTSPKCPSYGGTCMNTDCPFNEYTKEGIKEAMREWGSTRVAEYEQRFALSGENPRALAGQTVDQVVKYFKES